MKERIAHYRISCELGRGGMGVVYRAHEESLGRDVAIKVLGDHLAQDPAAVERFTREARSAAALNHPNIVQIYAIGEEEGRPYFVMEYVDGTSLQRLLQEQGRMDWMAAARIVVQAASGLAAAHERGIVHRDIKPANLLIDRRGLVKIADFGLALAVAGATRLTATGIMMGTPGYLSPEQCRDLDIDHRTDIYSLGATFYEMLTSSPPFAADSPLGLIKKIVEVEPPAVCAVNPTVDPAIGRILAKMMAKDRDQRYATCADVIADLEALPGVQAAPSSQLRATAPAEVPQERPAVDPDVNAAPTVASGGGLPPLPVTSSLPPTPPPPVSPPEVTAEPAPKRSSALPLLLVLLAVLLATAALGVGAVFAWRHGVVARTAARFLGGHTTAAPATETPATPLQASIPPIPAAAATMPPAPADQNPVAAAGTDVSSGVDGLEASEAHSATTAPAQAGRLGQPTTGGGGAAVASAPTPRSVMPPPPSRSRPRAEAPPPPEPTPAMATHGVMVVALGEPLLAGEARTYLETALRRGGAEVVDSTSAPEVEALGGPEGAAPRADLRRAVAPHARRLVLVRAEYLGERPLRYMGRSDTTYEARLIVTAVDLATDRPLGQPFDDTLEYNHLTVERVVAASLRPWLHGLVQPLTRR